MLRSSFFLACALAIASSVGARTSLAQTQLSRAADVNTYSSQADFAEVRKGSKNLVAAWKSTFFGQTKSFDGYLIPTSPNMKLAVRSDDGVNLWKNGTQVLRNEGAGQHWPNDASFIYNDANLSGGWVQDTPYRIQISFKTWPGRAAMPTASAYMPTTAQEKS